jgi:hypothetical protein
MMMSFPNLGRVPTVASARDGAWDDPTTWTPPGVPPAGAVVRVDHEVEYAIVSDDPIAALNVRDPHGCLHFDPAVSTRLTVGTLTIEAGGCMEVGDDPGGPVADSATAEVVFSGALDLTADPSQWGIGLIAAGQLTVRGRPITPFVRLAGEPKAGDTVLPLAAPVSGWRPGDRLVIPDTRQLAWNETGTLFHPQWETPTLQSVAPDGKSVTLAAPLAYAHQGGRAGPGAPLEFAPHVGNLTRNVVFRTAAGSPARGHLLATGRAAVGLRYALFLGLGRTTIDPLDDATFNADGTVKAIGKNQRARYPVHMHHLMGPEGLPAGTPQFEVVGCAVDGGDAFHQHKWGIDIHQSHFGLVQGNVVYNYAGACIATEDGSERGNVFEGNLAVRSYGLGTEFNLQFGANGDGFWFHGADNIVRDNVAANAYGGVYNFGYEVYLRANPANLKAPRNPGDDQMDYEPVVPDATSIREFAGNEAYGCAGGFAPWYLGQSVAPAAMPRSTVADLHVWNCYGWIAFDWPTKNLTYLRPVGRGQWRGHGLIGEDYAQLGLVIDSADLRGLADGVVVSIAGGDTTIRGGHFRNGEDIVIRSLGTVGYRADGIPPRAVTIAGTVHDRAGVPAVEGMTPAAIGMHYTTGDGYSRNLVQSDTVTVTDFGGVAGDSFRLYYAQQSPDFVMPQTKANADGSPSLLACPEAGLTNAQAFAKYGIAVGGSVAPAEAVARPGVVGLAGPAATP